MATAPSEKGKNRTKKRTLQVTSFFIPPLIQGKHQIRYPIPRTRYRIPITRLSISWPDTPSPVPYGDEAGQVPAVLTGEPALD